MTNATIMCQGWNCERILGTGGFGIVQLWLHKPTGQKLAIKKCKWNDDQLTLVQKQRWANEVAIMKQLDHPNIVKIQCIPFKLPDTNESMPVLCMEYCTKGDLRSVLNKAQHCCGIKEQKALKIMKDVLSAVEYLHKGQITHRDLKPENIVIQAINDTILYKLIDLGYAKEIGETSTSASLVGTLNYVAPELLLGKRYNCSVDYWSLGILFYEILTGKRPFLPSMPQTIQWMNKIKTKSYDDICAFESEGKVVFGTDIEEPVHLSSFFRGAIVDWLRNVLQWDPKKRGRKSDSNGVPQLVVFTSLQTTLSKKIVYVFFVSLYKVVSYEVSENSTIVDLEQSVQQDSGIPKHQLILTDYDGNILTEESLIPSSTDSVLFALKSGDTLIKAVPVPVIPSLVQKMVVQSKNELNFETIKNYYRATIFLMKWELYLFQLYIFALNIKVDLLNLRMDSFSKRMDDALTKANSLSAEMNSAYTFISNEEKKKQLKDNCGKVHTLTTAINQIQLKFGNMKETTATLRKFSQDFSTTSLYEVYDKALEVFETFRKSNSRTSTSVKMVKVFDEFMKIRRAQFKKKTILEFERLTVELEKKLTMLEQSFTSVTSITEIYKETLHTITDYNATASECSTVPFADVSNSLELSDSLIYDNLLVCHTIDNFIAEMQRKYEEIMRFDL